MRVLITIFTLFSLIYGVELSVKPDQNGTDAPPSQSDIRELNGYYHKYFNIRISPKGAKRLVKENRALANAYLRRYGLDPQVEDRLRVISEFVLADEMVQRIQRSIQIPPEVVHSYYLDHLDQFKRDDKVKMRSFLFKTPDDAMAFYMENKGESSLKRLEEAAKKYSLETLRDYKEAPLKALSPYLRSHIKKGKKGYLLPPQLSPSRYEVFYVEEYKEEKGYKPFDEVKEEIEKQLHQKRYIRDRKKIISSLEKGR